MRLLLDTHALLWALGLPSRLAPEARQRITNPRDEVFVSAASAWEIEIKRALGKLQAPRDLEAALAASDFDMLNTTVAHAINAGRLPRHHDDPFDRMLIAQAQADSMTIVTRDSRFSAYGVPVLPA